VSRDRDDELKREIRAHLELEAEERVAEGAAPDAARYDARRAFGNVARIAEDARAVWTPQWLDQLRQDVRYAARSLRRNPAFTLVALLAIALGIGATSAIFAVVNAVLLRPLPFPHADRLVRIFEHVPSPDGSAGPPRQMSALPLGEIDAFAARTKTLSHVGAHLPAIRTLTARSEPVRLVGARVSPATLAMLETPPVLGRLFHSAEAKQGADAVVVLSYGTWQQYFGADPNVAGQALEMDGRPCTIVGVMPRGFAFPDPRDQFWIPLTASGPMARQRLPILARLSGGASAASAAAELAALTPAPGQRPGRFEVVPMIDRMVAPVKPALLVLSAGVVLVLLIACANVANLLLARNTARRREMAVRLAIGAGRGRLIRQALTENVLLNLTGAAGGLAVAAGAVAVFRALAASPARRDLGPGIGMPRLEEIAIDAPVFLFTFSVAVATAVLVGVLPAVRVFRPGLTDLLREGAASARSGFNLLARNRAQGLLVAVQIAMATTLLVGSALLGRSFLKLSNIYPGYDPSSVLTFQISLPPGRPYAHLRLAAARLLERLQATPGLSATGYADALPLTWSGTSFVALRTTPSLPPPRRPPVGPIPPDYPFLRLVSTDFLNVMQVPLVAGRGFNDGDRAGASQVLLVNRTLARSGVLGADPIGRRIYALGEQAWEVVGIVEDTRQVSLTEVAPPQVYIDFRQVPDAQPMAGVGLYFAVRTDATAASLASTLRGLTPQVDAQTMVESLAPMDALVSTSISRPRLYSALVGMFAAVALLLAVTGIYGVMTYAVSQRVREIGIRMAIGAGRARVMGLVLGQSTAITLAGIALGLGGAAALTRYLEQLLFGVTALDPVTFAGVAALFAAIATIAAFGPAYRATRVDPVVALRLE
jgi:putative ABC transport system permease protein